MQKSLRTQRYQSTVIEEKKLLFKARVRYQSICSNRFAHRFEHVAGALDELAFVNISACGHVTEQPRDISFVSYRIPKSKMKTPDVLMDIKRQRLRPATFLEFLVVLELFPRLPHLHSLICLGSHAKLQNRLVVAAVERQPKQPPNLFLEDSYQEWGVGKYILCVLELN